MKETMKNLRFHVYRHDASDYLICESTTVFLLLMFAAGIMGAYTYNMRGGVFCNAQTANFIMMGIAFGKGDIKGALYYLIPVTAYFLGAFVSEILPTPVRKIKFLRWDTYLIAFETITILIVGLIPLSVPDQVVQVIINFIASMQYNTFRQAHGIPMATTFCTNHLRQVGIAFAKLARKHDEAAMKRGMHHVGMILAFLGGIIAVTFVCNTMQEKSIWLALIPMSIVLGMFVYADLISEHDLLQKKPSGH